MDSSNAVPESRRYLAFQTEHNMFITNISGKEEVSAKAVALGLKAGEALRGTTGYGRPALGGNTFDVKDALKAAGARWDGENKVWAFESWAALETAVNAL